MTSLENPAASVARLRSPGQVAAVIPLLVGFVPVESAVVLSLKEPRGRIGLTMRFDLADHPDARSGQPYDEQQRRLGAQYVQRLVRDRATRAVLVVHTAAPDLGGDLPRAALVRGFIDSLERAGIVLTEALLVRDGRWVSYTCEQPCCPRSGTPLADSARSEPVTRVAAELVLSGRQVLTSREQLVRSLAPVLPLGKQFAEALIEQVQVELVGEWFNAGSVAAARRTVALVREALRSGEPLSAPEQVRVALGLFDVQARDEVACLGLEQPEELQALLHELCRATLPGWDAPVCSVFGWIAYLAGEGALVNVALERALATDPSYSLARLLEQALLSQVPPADLRTVLAQAAACLEADGPAADGPAADGPA